MGRTSKEKQRQLITAFRNKNYVLGDALSSIRVSERTFRHWYVQDNDFRDIFTALEDEQMVFLRQTMREMAAGTHPSAEGKPDRTLLRYLLTDYQRRTSGTPKSVLDADEMELLSDLEDLTEEEIAALAEQD